MKAVADMQCLFLEEVVNIEAQMLCWERVISLCLDVLSFSDEYLSVYIFLSNQSFISTIFSALILIVWHIVDMLSIWSKFFVLHILYNSYNSSFFV